MREKSQERGQPRVAMEGATSGQEKRWNTLHAVPQRRLCQEKRGGLCRAPAPVPPSGGPASKGSTHHREGRGLRPGLAAGRAVAAAPTAAGRGDREDYKVTHVQQHETINTPLHPDRMYTRKHIYRNICPPGNSLERTDLFLKHTKRD